MFYLIANWKMQLLEKELTDLTTQIITQNKKTPLPGELILAPHFSALKTIGNLIKNTPLKLAAQNLFYHERGAYTGEISPLQLAELNVPYVIIGHSERRAFLHETDSDVNAKIKIALKNNLTPILCIGETFEERKLGKTELTLIRQIIRGLEDVNLNDQQKLIIAYEPVWVIGTGQAVKPLEAENAALVIRKVLLDYFTPEQIEKNISLIYGGSVDANNVAGFIIPELMTGALVGTASLTAEKFLPIMEKVATLSNLYR